MSPSIVSSFDKHVGPWRLSKDILGSGTTSTVVLATRSKLPSLIAAVKVISRRGLLVKAQGDPTALHLADSVIHREVLLMKLAAHERIVRLYDFFGNGDLVYIVMEHAPHKTLFDLFRAFPSYLPSSFVVHIFSQFMQGLAHVHDLHIVHRDLKLENVFLFGPDVKTLHEKIVSDFSTLSIKIGDFGLAHIDDPKRLSTVFHGSPHYQAPEVWRRYAHRSLPTDIWSAGVLFYALLCRRLPFNLTELEAIANPAIDCANEVEYGTSTSTLALSGAGEIYMRYKVPEFLPPAADTLLARLFAMTPSARPTARNVLDDAFFGGVSLSANSQTPPYNTSNVVIGTSVSLYDLATLCVPPGRHILYEAFQGSALERAMRGRLLSPESRVIEKTWAQKMSTYAADKKAWEAAVEEKVLKKAKKERTRSLGRKFKTSEVMGQRETTNLAVSRPKISTTFSFHSFRVKASSKVHEILPSANPVPAPHTTPSPSAIAWELEDRREALLRRAYELGFGTEDLRAFADEASRIVRVAKEGGRMGLEEIAREVERRGVYDAHKERTSGKLMPNTSACASAATLVPENVSCVNDVKAKLLDVPVVNVDAIGL